MSRTTKFFAPPQIGYRNLLNAFVLASVCLLLVASCNKDDIKPPIVDPDPQYAMFYKILTFLEQKEGKPLTQPTITPRTTYSPSDILDYVEGGMNLAYTDSRLTWASYDVRTDTFTIPLTSGYASQQDLEDLFDEIVDTASVHFYGVSEPDKFPYLYDATNISSNATIMNVSVTSRIGLVNRDPTPFGSTDYWSVWGGKCGPYSRGTLEASQVIANALIDYYAPYACAFYTNVIEVDENSLYNYGWSQPITVPYPGDFIQDFYTYVYYCWDYITYGDPEDYPECNIENGYPDCENYDYDDVSCFNPDEMNFYFESIRDIYSSFLDVQSNPYLTHIISDIRLQYTLCLNTSEYWEVDASFGQPNSCDESNYPTYLPPIN